MRAELAVLRCNGRTDHVAVDLLDGHPVSGRTAARENVAHHSEGDRRVRKPVDEHPQERDDEEGNDQFDDPAEYPPRPRAAVAPPALVAGDRSALRHWLVVSR